MGLVEALAPRAPLPISELSAQENTMMKQAPSRIYGLAVTTTSQH